MTLFEMQQYPSPLIHAGSYSALCGFSSCAPDTLITTVRDVAMPNSICF